MAVDNGNKATLITNYPQTDKNGKDSFEHSIFKKINEQQSIEEISKDIKIITNFIDELNLDNNLFKGSI